MVFFCLSQLSIAQEKNELSIHGDFQSDFQTYRVDSIIGTTEVPEKIGSNSYLNVIAEKGNFRAGARLEAYQPVIQGFDSRYSGFGVPYKFIEYRNDELEVTLGNIYEQFGNGLIFRTYQEWGLGFDNSLEGIRVILKPHEAIKLKGVIGKQRFYFDRGAGTVRGADVDISINDLMASWKEKSIRIRTGGSFISKYQEDNDPLLNLPENVASFAGRLSASGKKWSLISEYAYKFNDPSFTNGNIYKHGETLFLTGSYATKGLGITISGKRIDNMDFRSDRNATLNDLLINYLPPLAPQFTYRLASLYPYVTQPTGEMGIQAEVTYRIKRKTTLGGKYGTQLTGNYTLTRSIQDEATENALGYKSSFLKVGHKTYYENLLLRINRKLSKKWKVITTYMYIAANNDVLRITDAKGTIYSNIGIVDLSYLIKKNHTLRAEIQYLHTKQDRGSWATLLAEYSAGKHWFGAFLDDYNFGNANKNLRVHYPSLTIGYRKNTTRISVGYGRQRAGVICVGGVCRLTPATNGLNISLSSSF